MRMRLHHIANSLAPGPTKMFPSIEDQVTRELHATRLQLLIAFSEQERWVHTVRMLQEREKRLSGASATPLAETTSRCASCSHGPPLSTSMPGT